MNELIKIQTNDNLEQVIDNKMLVRISAIFKRYQEKEISESEYELLMKREYLNDPVEFNSTCKQILEETQAELRQLHEAEKDIRESQIKQIFDKMNPNTIRSIYATSQVYSLPLHSCVYFIRNEFTGLTKIGQAKNITKRFSQIKTSFTHVGIPANLKLVGAVLVYPQWLNDVERHFHLEFKNKRTYGEWFRISNNDIMEQLFYGSDRCELIHSVPVNYDDWEYSYFSEVKKEYEVSIEELGHTRNLLGIQDPFTVVFKRNNKLLEIIKAVEKHQVGFYDIVYDYNDFSKVHHVGVRYGNSDKWYSFQDIKEKAFSKRYWKNAIKGINSKEGSL